MNQNRMTDKPESVIKVLTVVKALEPAVYAPLVKGTSDKEEENSYTQQSDSIN